MTRGWPLCHSTARPCRAVRTIEGCASSSPRRFVSAPRSRWSPAPARWRRWRSEWCAAARARVRARRRRRSTRAAHGARTARGQWCRRYVVEGPTSELGIVGAYVSGAALVDGGHGVLLRWVGCVRTGGAAIRRAAIARRWRASSLPRSRASTYGEGADLAKVAERVGVTRQTVYRYFPSRRALFQAVAAARAGSLVERLPTMPPPPTRSSKSCSSACGRCQMTLSSRSSPDRAGATR